jgi:FAD:protein FMN transferase
MNEEFTYGNPLFCLRKSQLYSSDNSFFLIKFAKRKAMGKRTIIISLIWIVMVLTTISCNQEEYFHNTFGLTQGTTYSIVYQVNLSTKIEKINDAIEKRLVDIDRSLSIYNDSSLISAINRNEDVDIDSMFAEVFRISQSVSGMTDGLFDITVGPLVKAWGFGPDALAKFDSTRVDSLLEFVGFGKVQLANGKVKKSDDRIWLDMNAIAQGYSVDVICRLLDDFRIQNYLVEIGGEVRAKGIKGDRLWKVGLDKPVDNNNSPGEYLFAVVELEDASLATSGNYRKFHIGANGVKYSHTIDPRAGSPVRHTLLSATIIAPDCSTADAFATACMVAGVEGAKTMIDRYDFIEGYLIYSGENGEYLTWVSEGIKHLIKAE